MFSYARNANISYEKQSKFIQDRILSVEKHFSELCNAFGAFAQKTARVRDAGDDISKAFLQYSEGETVNTSLSLALKALSSTFSAVEDYRNAYVQRLEVKVVAELSQYDGICRHVRGEMKHTLTIRDGEIARRRTLDRLKERNPLSRQQIMQAESELLKASADMSRTSRELEEQTDLFEKRKLQDIKSIIKNFIDIEMVFHTKSLELLTMAHQQLNNVDDAADLQDFRSELTSMSDQQIMHSQTGHGSLASLLSQKTKPKKQNSMESVRTGDKEKNFNDDTETDEDSSEPIHKGSDPLY